MSRNITKHFDVKGFKCLSLNLDLPHWDEGSACERFELDAGGAEVLKKTHIFGVFGDLRSTHSCVDCVTSIPSD